MFEDPPLVADSSLLVSPSLFVGVSMTATDIVDSDGAYDMRFATSSGLKSQKQLSICFKLLKTSNISQKVQNWLHIDNFID